MASTLFVFGGIRLAFITFTAMLILVSICCSNAARLVPLCGVSRVHCGAWGVVPRSDAMATPPWRASRGAASRPGQRKRRVRCFLICSCDCLVLCVRRFTWRMCKRLRVQQQKQTRSTMQSFHFSDACCVKSSTIDLGVFENVCAFIATCLCSHQCDSDTSRRLAVGTFVEEVSIYSRRP